MKIALAQFAKSPEHTSVKTRLRPVLSPDQCVSVHKSLVSYVADQVGLTTNLRHSLWSTNGGAFIEQLCDDRNVQHFRQQGEDLGQRLANATEKLLRKHDAVVLIGSDCPFLSPSIYAKVGEALNNHDGVIVPAEDGGYVLLATKVCSADIFHDIAWGSHKVFEQTIARLNALKLNFACFGALADIDRPEDLKFLLEIPGVCQRLQHGLVSKIEKLN